MEQQPPAGIAQRWATMERAHQTTIVALGIMTLSQFMNYVAPHTEQRQIELLGVYTPTATSGFGVNEAVSGESGWSAHPYAWLILGALLVLFVLQLDLGEVWRRWRYWIAVAGMVPCLFPFDTDVSPGWGLLVGIIAVAIGVWSARLARRPAVAAA